MLLRGQLRYYSNNLIFIVNHIYAAKLLLEFNTNIWMIKSSIYIFIFSSYLV